ncbi:hypothetical protein, partial [Klebsiella pneumoniae]|uniref:hypothetical protein n=1 Tax=Klebsiella pneumoniae TaxID=573 RepID=UPI001953AB4B
SPEPLVASSVLSASLLIAGENDALKKKLLPKLASGEAIVGAGLAGRIPGLWSGGTTLEAKAAGSDAVLNGAVR